MGTEKKHQGPLLSRYLGYLNDVKQYFNLMTHGYQVLPAVTQNLQHEAHKVRHNVYCAELKYEDSNPDGMEKDQYDDHSSQLVVYSRTNKSYIGCVRLVHGLHEGNQYHLPFEHHCKSGLNSALMTKIKNSGQKYAEVSRLAVDRNYRHLGRSKSDHRLGKKYGNANSSCALFSLYLGIVAMARQQNIEYLFGIVEPRLLKNLHRHSVPAVQIGDGFDHRGLRVPIMINVKEVEKVIPKLMRPLYSAIHRDVSKMLAMVENETAVEKEFAEDLYYPEPLIHAQSVAAQ